jgi:hypothetical protein
MSQGAVPVNHEGFSIPFFLDYYEYKSIATANFSPIDDPSLTAAQIGAYTERGFLVRPNADGDVYGITWWAWHKNGDSLTGLTPQRYLGSQNQWIECRFVKIYAHNDSTYITTATGINVGIAR